MRLAVWTASRTREVQLLRVRVAEQQEASRAEDPDAAPVAGSGSMHIELPSSVRINLELVAEMGLAARERLMVEAG